MTRALSQVVLNFLQCKKTKFKNCHCILKNRKKSTRHYRKRTEKIMIVNSRNQNVNETLTKSSDVVKTREQDHADRIH